MENVLQREEDVQSAQGRFVHFIHILLKRHQQIKHSELKHEDKVKLEKERCNVRSGGLTEHVKEPEELFLTHVGILSNQNQYIIFKRF